MSAFGDRRGFLKTLFAALAGALVPISKEQGPVPAAVPVAPALGFLHEDGDDLIFGVSGGILSVGPDLAGLLFRDLVLVGRRSHDRTDIRGLVNYVMGPAPVVRHFCDRFSDVTRAATNTLKVGCVHADASPLWFQLPRVVFTSVGCSVTASPVEDDKTLSTKQEFTAIAELSFIASGEPAVCQPPAGLVLGKV